MPPKKTNSGASKKVEQKKKEKVIEVSSVVIKNIFIDTVWQINLRVVVTIYRIKRLA